MYQVSSKTGVRHKVERDLPSGDEAGRMWLGHDLPTAKCGRTLQPVNFYKPEDDPGPKRYQCSGCFRP